MNETQQPAPSKDRPHRRAVRRAVTVLLAGAVLAVFFAAPATAVPGTRPGAAPATETHGDSAAAPPVREAQDPEAPERNLSDEQKAQQWLDRPEELEEVLEKWADDYVTYLITDREKEIYEGLSTPEQKLAFIERFWEIRDPTPGTEVNEYRQDHMERYAFATRTFAAGKPGWRTDRGRMYILLGPPNQIQRNPTGRGPMERASETWTYNGVDNPQLPASFDLSFVDFHGTGEYELVTDLDATAPIWSEQFGFVNSNLDAYALRRHAEEIYDERLGVDRRVDPANLGFEYLEHFRTLREIAQVPEIHLERLRSLRESVEAEVSFDAVSLGNDVSYFEGVDGDTAVQVTVGVSYDDLRSTTTSQGRHFSTDLYVSLESEGEVVADDERRLNFTLEDEEWERLKEKRILQSFTLSVPPGEYDLSVIARDNVTQAMGKRQRTATVPDLSAAGLRLSSLTLASHVERVPSRERGSDQPFRHGDLRVIPNVGNAFYPGQNLFLYVQAYGLGIDADEAVNNVSLRGRITRDGNRFREIPAQHPYPAPKERMAFTLGVPLRDFPPGDYRVEVTVVDDVSGRRATATAPFRVLGPTAADAR